MVIAKSAGKPYQEKPGAYRCSALRFMHLSFKRSSLNCIPFRAAVSTVIYVIVPQLQPLRRSTTLKEIPSLVLITHVVALVSRRRSTLKYRELLHPSRACTQTALIQLSIQVDIDILSLFAAFH